MSETIRIKTRCVVDIDMILPLREDLTKEVAMEDAMELKENFKETITDCLYDELSVFDKVEGFTVNVETEVKSFECE